MKSASAILVLILTCAGCSLPPQSTGISLDEADRQLAMADYAGARDAYAGFAEAHPDSPHSARARATQAALDRLLRTQSELDAAKRTNETPRLLRELSERQNEVDRLKAEVAKLRGDLDRLRSIDLQTLPGGKK